MTFRVELASALLLLNLYFCYVLWYISQFDVNKPIELH